jgi:MoaA/NifB/PqqE/SkfB family radical SAM enzyme
MLTKITLREIERVFAILEELGLSREAVVIPLRPAHPGKVELRTDNRLEIVLDSDVPLDEWLGVVRERVRALIESGAGARLKRAES